jgi:hypothetical protein
MLVTRILPWVSALTLCCAGPACFADLLTNGDFHLGPAGFGSDYAFNSTLDGPGAEGRYFAGVNPHDVSALAASFGDHTSGNGLMLLMNGSPNPNTTVWLEQVAVTPGAGYHFVGFARSWGGSADPSPAVLRIEINGQSIGSDTALPAAVSAWALLDRGWNAGAATTATIRIVDMNTTVDGNDFALDDLSFETPEPGGFALTALAMAAGGMLRGRRRARNENGDGAGFCVPWGCAGPAQDHGASGQF